MGEQDVHRHTQILWLNAIVLISSMINIDDITETKKSSFGFSIFNSVKGSPNQKVWELNL